MKIYYDTLIELVIAKKQSNSSNSEAFFNTKSFSDIVQKVYALQSHEKRLISSIAILAYAERYSLFGYRNTKSNNLKDVMFLVNDAIGHVEMNQIVSIITKEFNARSKNLDKRTAAVLEKSVALVTKFEYFKQNNKFLRTNESFNAQF